MTPELTNTVENISKITSLIGNFGAMIVATAVLFVILIILVAAMLMQNARSSRQSDANFTKLLGHVIEEVPMCRTKEIDSDSHYAGIERDLVNYHLSVNQSMKDRLRALRDICDADRTYIFTFHNNERSIADFPYLKASYYIDWSRWSLRENKISEQRDIPAPILTTLCESLVNKGHLWSPQIDTYRETDPMFYAWLERIGAKCFYAQGLCDSRGRLIGFLGCDFVDDSRPIPDYPSDEIKKSIDQTARSISGILDVRANLKEAL